MTSCITDFSVRLVGDPAPNAGRVEVYYRGSWGTICNKDGTVDWNQNAADLVCEQLGYSGGAASYSGDYGRGSNPVIFTNLLCSSSDTSLAACRHDSLDSPSYCSTISAKAAGALCSGSPGAVPTPYTQAGKNCVFSPSASSDRVSPSG